MGQWGKSLCVMVALQIAVVVAYIKGFVFDSRSRVACAGVGPLAALPGVRDGCSYVRCDSSALVLRFQQAPILAPQGQGSALARPDHADQV